MFNFTNDHSTSNPDLHVGYALETLSVLNRTVAELTDHSRVTSSLFVGLITEEIRKLILTESAYRDAAALLAAGIDHLEPESDDWQPMNTAPRDGTIIFANSISMGKEIKITWSDGQQSWLTGTRDGITYFEPDENFAGWRPVDVL